MLAGVRQSGSNSLPLLFDMSSRRCNPGLSIQFASPRRLFVTTAHRRIRHDGTPGTVGCVYRSPRWMHEQGKAS
ncbi:hypothetical protein G7K_6323-t1 [Saitoella complicata NRRL Y-17804]|uniref:Uncharacterized protein n=1 Tax=Saitoella complicata (strain BCRC 22490 / CBS 7301 / JCM 7358 / NBRC 10748 / NRRL Y-17804) TaxID=698492 RepID=A0A0E9NQT7_SAICN|nr:hypothetical protein G7K_6323-t1 [Saitoella complicata NRRL Y-17804]